MRFYFNAARESLSEKLALQLESAEIDGDPQVEFSVTGAQPSRLVRLNRLQVADLILSLRTWLDQQHSIVRVPMISGGEI